MFVFFTCIVGLGPLINLPVIEAFSFFTRTRRLQENENALAWD